MSTVDDRRPAEVSAGELLSTGVVVPGGARVLERRADAVLAIDQSEHGRRVRCGQGPVTDLALLDGLLSLPLEHWVQRVDLEHRARVTLRRAPGGVVESTPTQLRRVFRPAAMVRLVVVHARQWDSGLRRAAAFAGGYAPTVMVLHGAAKRWSSQVWEASYFGVGVCVPNATAWEELLAPQRCRPHRITAAWWAFQEHAYQVWLRSHQLDASRRERGERQ